MMHSSKSHFFTSSLIVVVCVPLGYVAAMAFETPKPDKIQATKVEQSGVGEGSETKTVVHERGRRKAKPGSRLELVERIAVAGIDELLDLSREILGDSSLVDLSARVALFDRWIELDAERGWEIVQEEMAGQEEEGRHSLAVSIYSGRWALVDPDSVFVASQGIDEENLRKRAMGGIANSLSSYRPADFFRLFQGNSDPLMLFYQKTAAKMYAISDPRAAVAAIGGLSLSAELASGWAKNDPDAALA